MVEEFWIQAKTKRITHVDLDGVEVVIKEVPDIAGFTDGELLRIVCKAAVRVHGNWWHCFVGTNGGTDDWTDVHERIALLDLAGTIVTDIRQLPGVKDIDVPVVVSVDRDGEPIMGTEKRSVRDVAALHSFGITRGDAPGGDRP